VQTINFNPGETAQISGQTQPQQIKLPAQCSRGPQVSVAVEQGSVTLDIVIRWSASGKCFKLLNWQAQVPRSGEYQMIPIQDQDTDFTLDVSARN